MRKAKRILFIVLAAIIVVAMTGCARVTGIISPVESTKEVEVTKAFEKAGISLQAARAADSQMFQYQFQEPVHSLRVWAEMYKDGQQVGDPVELYEDNLTEDHGIIAFFTSTAKGRQENFALFASNGVGSTSKAAVQLGTIDASNSLTPTAQSAIDDTQITELGKENVLLVLHDGPGLQESMRNDTDQIRQIMDSSTSVLAVYCTFS